jgi:hypothetical protein
MLKTINMAIWGMEIFRTVCSLTWLGDPVAFAFLITLTISLNYIQNNYEKPHGLETTGF